MPGRVTDPRSDAESLPEESPLLLVPQNGGLLRYLTIAASCKISTAF